MEYDKQNTNYAKKKPSTPTKYQVREPKYQVRQPKIYAVLSWGNFCRKFMHFLAYFLEAKKYGGVRKKTNMRYDADADS